MFEQVRSKIDKFSTAKLHKNSLILPHLTLKYKKVEILLRIIGG